MLRFIPSYIALLKTIEQEEFGRPILSPRSLVEHLIAEPEVELDEATLGKLNEVCGGDAAGHNAQTYEELFTVLKNGGE